jgi:hypothetical protein
MYATCFKELKTLVVRHTRISRDSPPKVNTYGLGKGVVMNGSIYDWGIDYFMSYDNDLAPYGSKSSR